MKKLALILLATSSIISPQLVITNLPAEKQEVVAEEQQAPAAPQQTTIVQQESQQAPSWKKFFTTYASTIVAGVPVGMTTGALCAYVEGKTGCPLFLSWLIFWGVRGTMVKTICDDMERNHIPHNRLRAHECAFVADWATYFAILTTCFAKTAWCCKFAQSQIS